MGVSSNLMNEDHERYQQLAVGHVLGGLAAEDASSFRAHLLGCRDCRLRVAELRGIASDLEAAERDERARALITARDEDEQDLEEPPQPPRPRVGIRHVTVAVVVVALLAGVMAFWNLHLRTTTAAATGVAEQQTDVLEILAEGLPLSVEGRHPVQGVAAISDGDVAVSVVGLPDLDQRQLVVWRRGEDGVEPVRTVSARQLGDGPLALAVEADGADELVLSLEEAPLGEGPDGPPIARVTLSPGG
jgi:hypothetical protein